MDPSPTSLLLVGDRRAHSDVLLGLLEASHHEIVIAPSGTTALAAIETQELALIVLVPGRAGDGLEIAASLMGRARKLGRPTPLLVVAPGEVSRELVLAAYAAGAVDIVPTPLDPAVFSAKIAVLAELGRARAGAHDIGATLATERKRAEEQERRFRLLVESVKDYAIFILDPQGVVATWNPGAERIKGYSASEIIGRHFSAFYPADVVASGKCEIELEVAAREGRFEEEGWRLRKDGSRFWANVTITALRDPTSGELVGFAKVTRDLTDRIQHEATLQHLAIEKARLAEKARIQEFQERFIAILGHDLRNPLSAIDMAVTLLQQRATTDDTTRRILERAKSSSSRMSRMIEQILDLTRSRLGGGLQMETASMDLSAMLTAIADELRTAHPDRTVEVRGPPSMIGWWDRDRLEQVFSNLIGNALAYSPKDGAVAIDLREDGGAVFVSIHNRGAPIAESQRAELWNPFRRGERDSRRPETAGLGLGLYISREVVVGHGGTIELRSDAATGTTFIVTLPRSREEPAR